MIWLTLYLISIPIVLVFSSGWVLADLCAIWKSNGEHYQHKCFNRNQIQCIVLGVVVGLMSVLGLVFFYLLLEGAKNGWLNPFGKNPFNEN